jgi:hypothetical protein
VGGKTLLDVVGYTGVERCIFTPEDVNEIAHFLKCCMWITIFCGMVLLP